MTFPYGSKQRGFSDQILKGILNPHIKEHGGLKFNPMLLSNLLAKINCQSVKQIVLKASEAMNWMQQAARMVAKEGRLVCWTTPLGFPVVQNHLCTKEARVETSLAGERKVFSIREQTLKPDARKAVKVSRLLSFQQCYLGVLFLRLPFARFLYSFQTCC